MNPKINIDSSAVDMLQLQVDVLVAACGHDPATVLVTDLCTFLDLLCCSQYPTLQSAQDELNEALRILNLTDVAVDVESTLVDAARQIEAAYPGWPAPPTIH